MNRTWTAVVAAWVLLAAGCTSKPAVPPSVEEAPPLTEGIVLSAEARKLAGIETQTVGQQTLVNQLVVPGQVTVPSNARAVLTPPVPGRIIELRAAIGQSVRKGDVLAVIQSAELADAASAIAEAERQEIQAKAVVEQQSNAVEIAENHLRTALSNLQRQRAFAKAGAFSQPSLTAARNELSEAQTEQSAAKSELTGAQTRLDRAERLNREGLIARAEYEQAKLDVQQAQIRLERAAERIRLAQETYSRENRLAGQGLLNAREIQAVEAEERAARLELDRARIEFRASQSALLGAHRAVQNAQEHARASRGGSQGSSGNVVLTAPITGTITDMHATIGQAVERSSDLFDIEDLRRVWVTANVPEADIARVQKGTPVTVTTSAYPGKVFSGRVNLVGARLDAKSRTLPVQCLVPNPDGKLRGDLFASVRIDTHRSIRTLAVPIGAIGGEGNDAVVFVEIDGAFRPRTVKVGRTDGTFAEISEGLEPGERVATSGIFVLQSEMRKDELKEED